MDSEGWLNERSSCNNGKDWTPLPAILFPHFLERLHLAPNTASYWLGKDQQGTLHAPGWSERSYTILQKIAHKVLNTIIVKTTFPSKNIYWSLTEAWFEVAETPVLSWKSFGSLHTSIMHDTAVWEGCSYGTWGFSYSRFRGGLKEA